MELFEDSVRIERLKGEERVSVAVVIVEIAEMLEKRGQLESAELRYRESLEMHERVAPDQWRVNSGRARLAPNDLSSGSASP